MSAPRAVVLLSGGIDSSTAAAVARRDGFELFALTVRYRQRHDAEIDAARRVAAAMAAREHRVVDVDLGAIGGSALTDASIPVPVDRPAAELARGIPPTYVPARNTILLGLAVALAETVGARDLFAGMNVVDYSGYPDCRPEFLEAFERVAAAGTRAGAQGERFRIHAPLLDLDKAAIIRLAGECGLDLGLTWSCYDPRPAPGGPRACGRCDACAIRRRGFREARVPDPTRYAEPA